MNQPIHDAQAFDKFFQAIAPLAEGYSEIDFRYFAIKQGDQFILVQGRLIFASVPPYQEKSNFKSENILCGRFKLSELKRSPEQLAAELMNGKIQLPGFDLMFPKPDNGNFCTSYQPLHQSGLALNSRYNATTIYGADMGQIVRQPLLEWELRASDTPYDTLVDLVADYKCGPLTPGAAEVEFAALQVASIQYNSPVSGAAAIPTIFAAKTLDPQKISMGYKILSNSTVMARNNLGPDKFSWITQETQMTGTATLTVPEAAIIQCFVKYNGIVQHHGWIFDLATSQNPRRVVYEGIDPKLESLKEILARRGKSGNARDVEAGVAWLLWMFGFSPAHFGAIPKFQEAPDLVVVSPSGHHVVIECTTGQLRSDNKLPTLVERTEQIRAKLSASNHGHIRVLSVMVTTLSRMEVRADLEQAEKLGVLVMSKENLMSGIERTMIVPNADQMYAEAEEQTQALLAKHRSNDTVT